MNSITCMAIALYFESRSENIQGMIYVADTILNRVESSRYPDNVCDVVTQPHQFSFLWDGKQETIKNLKAWEQSMFVAKWMLEKRRRYVNSCHYHATYVSPTWSKSMKVALRYKNHIFYDGSC